MKKIAILLIICLAITALAGCARADQRKEEFATLTQPEQTIQKDEVTEQKEPNDIDLTVEPDTDEPIQPNKGSIDQTKLQSDKDTTIEKESSLNKSPNDYEVSGVPEGSQFDLATLPRNVDECVGTVELVEDTTDFERLQSMLDPNRSIVIRGKVNGKSTQYRSENSRKYIETPILVQEVYYGNVKAGDVINCYQKMFVHLHDGEPVLECYSFFPPLENDTEYLFILPKYTTMNEIGTGIYRPGHSRSPYIPISKLETLQNKKDLTIREECELDALTYYYLGQRGEETE